MASMSEVEQVIGRHVLLMCLALATLVDCRPAPRACPLPQRAAVCHVEVSDPPCFACLKQSCCAEGNACFIPGTPCMCQFVCTMRHEPDCEGTCGKPEGRYEAINACKIAHCNAECTL